MKKIRINELARECEQPNSVILALLPQFGITEKKTHSSSIDEEVADKIRRYFGIKPAEDGSAAGSGYDGSRACARGRSSA
jgi:translation initiation factor IF-2